jgi:hypothetical protein
MSRAEKLFEKLVGGRNDAIFPSFGVNAQLSTLNFTPTA